MPGDSALAGLLILLILALPGQASQNDGMAAVQAGDWKKASAEFEPLAQKGDPHAQVNLGNLYMRGLGVAQNYAEAARWYEKAAQQGQPTAMGKLGLMHYYGLGMPEDHTEAGLWFLRAADRGDPEASMILAELYADGDGVEKNNREAYFWSSVASDLGKAEAGPLRDQLANELAPADLDAALTRLNLWRQQHDPISRAAAAPEKPPAPLPNPAKPTHTLRTPAGTDKRPQPSKPVKGKSTSGTSARKPAKASLKPRSGKRNP